MSPLQKSLKQMNGSNGKTIKGTSDGTFELKNQSFWINSIFAYFGLYLWY